jgi:DNA-binding transcriptional LysR family regulator
MDIGLSRCFKIRQLQLVAAIAEHGQLSIAADAVAITQPAASRMLAEIEHKIGAKLFERHAKGMVLTVVGQALAQRAHSLLVELRDLSREVEELKHGAGGLASVGAVTGAAVGFVIPAIKQLKLQSPHTEIHVKVGTSEELVHDLVAGKSDFVLARIPSGVDPNDFDIEPAQNETVKLHVRQDHPLVMRTEKISVKELSDYEWVMQPLRSPIREAVEATFLNAGAKLPSVVINTTSLLLIIAALASSSAIAPLSREVSDLLLSENVGAKFTVLPVAEKIEVSPYYFIQVKGRKLSPISCRLKSLVRHEYEERAF